VAGSCGPGPWDPIGRLRGASWTGTLLCGCRSSRATATDSALSPRETTREWHIVARRAPSGSEGVQNREFSGPASFNRVALDHHSCTVQPPPTTSGRSEGPSGPDVGGGTSLQSSHVGGGHRE